jgi:hypothetical protein
MEQHPEQSESQPAPAVPATKKPYTRPTLTRYGNAADLTKGGATPGSDIAVGGASIP